MGGWGVGPQGLGACCVGLRLRIGVFLTGSMLQVGFRAFQIQALTRLTVWCLGRLLLSAGSEAVRKYFVNRSASLKLQCSTRHRHGGHISLQLVCTPVLQDGLIVS